MSSESGRGAPTAVLLAITSLRRGGAERQLIEIVAGIDRDRWTPIVALCDPTDEYGLQLDSTRIHDLRSADASTPMTGVRLARIMVRERIEVVHSFGGLLNFYACVAARMTGGRRVVSSVLAGIPDRRDVTLERLSRPWTHALVVNSVGIRDQLTRRAGYSADAIDVIPNGIDVRRFRPLDRAERDASRTRWSLNGPTLVVMARVTAEKNHPGIVEALGLLRGAGALPPNATVLFAGHAPDAALRETLDRRIEALGLRGVVRFLGSVREPESLLGAADGAVLVSHYEGMSNAVLEAMACGTPVVVSPGADRDVVVRDGIDGVRTTGADARGIADAIARFFSLDDVEREHLGRTARARVEGFTVEAMVARMESVWSRVLDRPPTP